jgi:hypothetical protein
LKSAFSRSSKLRASKASAAALSTKFTNSTSNSNSASAQERFFFHFNYSNVNMNFTFSLNVIHLHYTLQLKHNDWLTDLLNKTESSITVCKLFKIFLVMEFKDAHKEYPWTLSWTSSQFFLQNIRLSFGHT